MKNVKYMVLLFLFVISFASSIALSISSEQELCNIQNGCETVHYSPYNYTFGIQNSYFGVVIFFFLIILTVGYLIKPTSGKKAIVNLSILVGSLVSLYFLYIQFFVLKAFCQYCLIVDISILISLILIIPELRRGFSAAKFSEK